MRFAFNCRVTVECMVVASAATEQEAWAQVLDGKHEVQLSEFSAVRKPIYTRTPQYDDFDL